jgi:hypothetical protein
MLVKQFVHSALAVLSLVKHRPPRDERGISQSAESAILLAGAVAIAIVVVSLITAFVQSKLAGI